MFTIVLCAKGSHFSEEFQRIDYSIVVCRHDQTFDESQVFEHQTIKSVCITRIAVGYIVSAGTHNYY